MSRRSWKVATLALIYRELYDAQHGAPDICRYDGPEWLLDPLEHSPGDLTLLGMIGSQALTDLDWFILWVMEQHPNTLPALAQDIAAIDSVRSEALLYAWPLDEPAPEPLQTETYRRRRHEVERTIDELLALGVAATKDDVELVATKAYKSATGRDAWEDFPES